jgi:hypothetical protein
MQEVRLMQCVLITGITGSERRQYLAELKDSLVDSKKLEVIDPWERTKELHPNIDEATVLNVSDEDRLDFFADAYKDVADSLEKMREASVDTVVAVPTHSVFYWKSVFKDAVRDEFVEWLSPDLFVTVVHNMKVVKDNLDKDAYSRFPGITLPEILQWRLREIQETSRWANTFNKQHVVVARAEPIDTLSGILFNHRKKIYFSYPMSYVSSTEMNKAKKLIKKLRDNRYVVFDPDSIDDAKYIGELGRLMRIKSGVVSTKKELSNIARIVGNHTVDLDYRLIQQSDMVVARYPSVEYKEYIIEKNKISPAMYVPLSAGVICEMVRGNEQSKRVYAVWLPKVEPSPFFVHQCLQLFTSEQALLDHLQEKEPPGL